MSKVSPMKHTNKRRQHTASEYSFTTKEYNAINKRRATKQHYTNSNNNS